MSRYPASPVKEMRKTAASTPQTRKLRICRKGTEAASGQSACMSAYVLQFNSIGAGGAASCRIPPPRKSETNVAEYGRTRSNYSGIRVPSLLVGKQEYLFNIRRERLRRRARDVQDLDLLIRNW